MPKLIIFDKDGTLTEPISGGAFVQHPHDQRLRPGVAEKLEQLRSDGVMMAIASNQGGCAVFEIAAQDIKPGMSIYLDGHWVKVQEVEATSRNTHLLTDAGRHTISGLIDARFKSIDDAVEEMKFAMELTEINHGFFCPDDTGSIGQNLFSCEVACGQFSWGKESLDGWRLQGLDFIGFRKPSPGMLLAAKYLLATGNAPEGALMVGDRTDDAGAAISAGFEFEWAVDYFGGFNA